MGIKESGAHVLVPMTCGIARSENIVISITIDVSNGEGHNPSVVGLLFFNGDEARGEVLIAIIFEPKQFLVTFGSAHNIFFAIAIEVGDFYIDNFTGKRGDAMTFEVCAISEAADPIVIAVRSRT